MARDAVKSEKAAGPAAPRKKASGAGSTGVAGKDKGKTATARSRSADADKRKTPERPAAQPAAAPAVAAIAKEKPRKQKMVRDSFTMPEGEYKILGEVKRLCLKSGIEVKKSQLLRIGVELIRRMEPAQLAAILATLTPMKAGRPKKEK